MTIRHETRRAVFINKVSLVRVLCLKREHKRFVATSVLRYRTMM
jgi:hypothetical protein